MDGVPLIHLSDLLLLSRPLTGAAALSSSAAAPPSKKPKLNPLLDLHSFLSDPNCNSSSKTFVPLDHPVLLIGTVDLPSDGPHHCSGAGNRCLAFSDSSSTVCCAVLNPDVNLIGRRIHVLAWNFLPFEKGGLLEVIRWSFPASLFDTSPNPSISPQASAAGRSKVRGALRAVSPVFMTPSANSSDAEGSVGFLAEISSCATKPVFVYFLKPASLWRLAFLKLIGKSIEISGLKKKKVVIGDDEQYLLYVANGKPEVSMFQMPMGIEPKDGCDGRVYNGVVTGVYMQGMAIELDEKVLLLVTDPMSAPQHCLRIGAIVSIRNFHLLRAEFSCLRVLLLGTCIRTSIDVKSFSLSYSSCHVWTPSESLLGKFIKSLNLSARLWVLLLVSCFRTKFSGIFSNKEILGSKNREGFAQIYARVTLPSDVYQAQPGVFMDFCNHDRKAFRTESKLSLLKLPVPISNFISKCESLWLSLVLQLKVERTTVGKSVFAHCFSSEGSSYCRVIRKIISSKDLGLTLIGTLKSSPTSGSLQLVDATGSVDVIVPDLISDMDVENIYEVKDYEVIVEGWPSPLNSMIFQFNEPISCRSIFQKFPLKKTFKQLKVYVHFYLRDSRCLNSSFPVPPSMVMSNVLRGKGDRVFHLLYVTHKFPGISNNQGDRNMADGRSMFAEAVILPFALASSPNHVNSRFARCPIPCLLTLKNPDLQGSPISGYLHHTDERALENILDKHLSWKILFEFQSDSFTRYQLLVPGACYILCNKEAFEYPNCGKVLVNSQTTLMSVSFFFDEVAHQNELPLSHSFSISSSRVDNCASVSFPEKELILQQSINGINRNPDVRLDLCVESYGPMTEETEAVKRGFIRLITFLHTPGKTLSVSSCIQVMNAETVRPFLALDLKSSNLPEGRLISLTGNIDHVHICHSRSRSHTNSTCYTKTGNASELTVCKICIHISDYHHLVRLRGNFNKYACPIGFGPGVNATFHRILLTTRLGKLALTPVSFVVINSIKEVNQFCETSLPLPRTTKLYENFDMVSFGLVSQLVRCMESKLIRLHCRVVAVRILVLEKHTHDSGMSQQRRQFKAPLVKIPLAGFVLDDGSSLCCCWADGSKAETLLGLNEIPMSQFGRHCKSSNRIGSNKSRSKNLQDNVGCDLENILKKHRRFIIKNHGLVPDSSSYDLTVSVESDKIITKLEENTIKLIILNACGGSSFDVVGNSMDVNALEWLDTDFLDFQPSSLSIPNIWVREVQKVNPLKVARSMLHELLTR